MRETTLFVHYRTMLVGSLTPLESGRMRFQYAESWSGSPSAFPISLSLPLDGAFTEAARHGFFANLLPEGLVREQICRALQICTDHDFQLLQAIGGDCAGALTITPALLPAADDRSASGYERVSDEQLERWAMGAPTAFSEVTGRNQVRLSLAGAQYAHPQVCVTPRFASA